MSELDFEFELEGRTVRPGQVLHVLPEYWRAAGATAKVERYYGRSVILRADNGAVPTVPLSALSWEPNPVTVAMEQMRASGIERPSFRDARLWVEAQQVAIAQLDAKQGGPVGGAAQDDGSPSASPEELRDNAAVDAMAMSMKRKLARARAKGRGGWQTATPEHLSALLREHVDKGDPVDVANFCAFLVVMESGITPAVADAGGIRETQAAEIRRLSAERDALQAEADAKQAKIDRLMLEHCPAEMAPEQRAAWAEAQRAAVEPKGKV